MTTFSERQPRLGVPQRPFRRSRLDAILGGVCGGLATRFGVRPKSVRVVVAIVSVLFGAGVVLYALLWLLTPRDGDNASIAQHLLRSRSSARTLIGSGGVTLVVLFVLNLFARRATDAVVFTVVIACATGVAVWRGASGDERHHLQGVLAASPVLGAASARGWRAVALRVLPGVVLVVVGMQVLSRIGGVLGGAVPAFVGGGVLLIGLAVLGAPWWLTNVRDLSQERRARIRSEERANLAAHVHDSVLQTLTLIERAADDPAEVVRLARSQERALRDWLFAPTDAPTSDSTSFQQLLREMQGDVERDYKIRVELVVVGDCVADVSILALIAAGREAAVNAAKWSGVDTVAVYGEVEAARVALYVRDTGVGFDTSAVDARRQGIVHSIEERVRQHGGDVDIHSRVGYGTEVRLST
ncbi:MAG: PspC domain-containing protein, partial [Acidobacteriota bacterium]|nr:PspC domain-containing protein [Acidobacteriota bacterium]